MAGARRWPPPPAGSRPCVRVVAPSGTLLGFDEPLSRGLARLEAAGAEVRFDEALRRRSSRGYFAEDDVSRAEAFCAALVEPGVDVVWFARGGSGGARMAEAVLRQAVSLAPRAVVGFSDATTLLNGLVSQCGWVCFHGPVITSLGSPDKLLVSMDQILAQLNGRHGMRSLEGTAGGPRGVLRGGNCTVLASLAGTGLFPADATGPAAMPSIWLMEDVAEAPYRLDRSLTQLRMSGLFQHAAAIWVGDLGLDAEAQQRVMDALRIDLRGVPVVSGAPAGHRGRLELLPLGATVELDPETGGLQATSPWVATA